VTLASLLEGLGQVDLIDMDIEGQELPVIRSTIAALNPQVKRLHKGLFLRNRSERGLFLNPDTGIRDGVQQEKYKYPLPAGLFELMGAAPARIISVYQHVRAEATRQRVERALTALPRPPPHFSPSRLASRSRATSKNTQ
jgi:hypothetical protein